MARLGRKESYKMERIKTLVIDESRERKEIKKVGEETAHISIPRRLKRRLRRTR